MTEAFNEAFDIVISYEKGYVNDPNDKGGETKFGISKKWHPEVDIKNLTIDGAKDIYFKEYWNNKKLNLERVSKFNIKVAIELFDISVNQGIFAAAKYLQKALNLFNRDGKLFPDITVDGWIGESTLGALEKLKSNDKSALLKCINGLQFMRYYSIANNDKSQENNFVGWMKRV